MTAPSAPDPNPDPGVADYYNRKPKRATSRLVALAPDVLLLAHCEGAPETARYFAERLEAKVTVKMIKTIKDKVGRGTLIVTGEELEKAALSHPITAARFAREPWLCDPQFYRAAIVPEHYDGGSSPVKNPAKTASKKPVTKKAPKEPDSQPPSGDSPEITEGMSDEGAAGESRAHDAEEVEDQPADTAKLPSSQASPPATGAAATAGSTSSNPDLPTPEEISEAHRLLDLDDEEDAELYS